MGRIGRGGGGEAGEDWKEKKALVRIGRGTPKKALERIGRERKRQPAAYFNSCIQSRHGCVQISLRSVCHLFTLSALLPNARTCHSHSLGETITNNHEHTLQAKS